MLTQNERISNYCKEDIVFWKLLEKIMLYDWGIIFKTILVVPINFLLNFYPSLYIL